MNCEQPHLVLIHSSKFKKELLKMSNMFSSKSQISGDNSFKMVQFSLLNQQVINLTCAWSPRSRLAADDPGQEHTGQQRQLRHQGLHSLSSIHTQPD